MGSINNSIQLSREMNNLAGRVALLLTFIAIVFANIEIDVTDSVADELNGLDAGENRNTPCYFSGYTHCYTACRSQPCTANCTATCGYIFQRSNTFQYSGFPLPLCTAG